MLSKPAPSDAVGDDELGCDADAVADGASSSDAVPDRVCTGETECERVRGFVTVGVTVVLVLGVMDAPLPVIVCDAVGVG